MVSVTVVGVFPSTAGVQAVVDRLETAGFDRAQFGVLAPHAALAEGLGSSRPNAIADDQQAPTMAVQEPESRGALGGALIGGLAYVGATLAAGAVIVTGGGLGIALAAILASGGGGGLIGALIAHGIFREHAELIGAQLESGGVVLWVKPRNDAERQAALAALKEGCASHIVTQDPNSDSRVFDHPSSVETSTA